MNKRYWVLENLLIPYLIIKALLSNLFGKGHLNVEKYYFGKEQNQYIVFITPKTKEIKNKLLFFTYGGGWKRGYPYVFRFIGFFFARLGYVTILTGYRLVPRYRYPIPVEDTISSINYGLEVAKQKGLIKDDIVLIGQSAGGHLISLIAYNEQLKSHIQANIKGIISISGVVNFDECRNKAINRLVDDFVVNETNRNEANPYIYLNESVKIPILCIHGEVDPLVDKSVPISFVEKVNNYNQGLGKVVMIKKGLHSDLTKLFWYKLKEKQDLIDWIEQLE